MLSRPWLISGNCEVAILRTRCLQKSPWICGCVFTRAKTSNKNSKACKRTPDWKQPNLKLATMISWTKWLPQCRNLKDKTIGKTSARMKWLDISPMEISQEQGSNQWPTVARSPPNFTTESNLRSSLLLIWPLIVSILIAKITSLELSLSILRLGSSLFSAKNPWSNTPSQICTNKLPARPTKLSLTPTICTERQMATNRSKICSMTQEWSGLEHPNTARVIRTSNLFNPSITHSTREFAKMSSKWSQITCERKSRAMD